MISYSVYKVLHVVGLTLVFLALGGVLTHVINGGGKEHRWRKAIGMSHGIGLFLVLLGGFGLLARIGVPHGSIPTWALLKIALWLLLGGMLAVAYRKPSLARLTWSLVVVIGGLGAYLAGSKPF